MPLVTSNFPGGITTIYTFGTTIHSNSASVATSTETFGLVPLQPGPSSSAAAATSAPVDQVPVTPGGSSVSGSTVAGSSSAGTSITATTSTNSLSNAQSSSSSSSPKSIPSTTSLPHSTSTSPVAPLKSGSSTPRQSEKPHDDRLANGTVAGIVVGVAVGLASITFLLTFLFLRRRRNSEDRKSRSETNDHHALNSMTPTYQSSQNSPLEPKGPMVTEHPTTLSAFESHLPQPADDATVNARVKTTFDQIELHVENFYQRSAESATKKMSGSIAMFDSQTLPESLTSLLEQSTNATPILKHALIYFTTTNISLSGKSQPMLLPTEFMALPSTLAASNRKGASKSEYDQALSRWRVLTAYLRSLPLQNHDYLAQRDIWIDESVQAFSQAFAPWRNMKYRDEDRARSLSAILRSAAELGIWIFSQPSDFQFRWPQQSELGPNRIAVGPALVKMTDERGVPLKQVQVMLETVSKSWR